MELDHYRALVGAPDEYDVAAAMQFNLLTFLGLREYHFLLDIGCGSLRGGRLFIPYLKPARYFGMEPNHQSIRDGIKNELGEGITRVKRPVFNYDENFTLSIFEKKFDFLIAQSIFSHASQDQIRRCLSEARKVMMPTSIFAATFIKGEQNNERNNWSGKGVTYTLEHMKSFAEQQGLTCKPISWPHHGGQTWMLIVNPEHEKALPDLERTSQTFSISRTLRLEKEVSEVRLYKTKLRLSENRLSKIENNPYVRFGFKIHRFIRRVRRA